MPRSIAHLRRHGVAYLALFVALGGTGYAAVSLPRNSVGTKQLRKHAVTYSKLAPKAAALLHGAPGPAGATGPAGAAGTAGHPGADGAPAAIRRTRIDWTTQVPALTATNFTKVRDFGTFTKQQASSVVRVTVLDDGAASMAQTCVQQIRIDGKNDAGSAGTATLADLTGGEAFFYNPSSVSPPWFPWTAIAQFAGLAAGQHTVQLWGFVSGGSCTENAGGWTHTAFVDELS